MIILISVSGLLIRASGSGFQSSDFESFLNPWAREMSEMTVQEALSTQVGDYNVLYQELILLMTRLPLIGGHVILRYKVLSCLFDYVLAYASAAIVCEITGRKASFAPAYALALILPSVFMNSSVWAQADAIYTLFGMLGVLFLLRKKYVQAFLFLGVSFAFKLQAVFFVPVFLYVCVREQISFVNFLWVPAVMYAVAVPAFLAGRPLSAPLAIYLNQTSEYPSLSCNAPNFWGPFNLMEGGYSTFYKSALFLCTAVLLTGFYVLISSRKNGRQFVIDTGTFFAWTCFMFLPCMHERYQYPAEVMLVISAAASGRRSTAAAAFLAELCIVIIYVQYFAGVTIPQTELTVLSAVNLSAYAVFAVSLFADREGS